jgi:MoaA/NifB/PqqE/SkfB family radical SAM enzyme
VNLKTAPYLVSKIPFYMLARRGIIGAPSPLTLTFSVTNMCQSRCKTCNIWKIYLDNPKLKENELKIDEIKQIFRSLGHIFFFNISGGEPFLRKDLPEIVNLACKYLKPGVIHIPTNGIAINLIEDGMVQILEIMTSNGYGDTPITIKPSFDGVEEKHDEIRGVKGNFEKVLDTYEKLVNLKKKYQNLHVGLGTVISRLNYSNISEIAAYAERLYPDSYINEIAEQRSELFTKDAPITPTDDAYEKAIKYFSEKSLEIMRHSRTLDKAAQSVRLVYYDLVVRILREKRQVIPCYAGLSNVHISPHGEVWPCCILGYDKPMGNLREVGYDFKKVWHSEKANNVRKFIKDGNCYCPMANQAYSNILFSLVKMTEVMRIFLTRRLLRRK